MKTLIIVASARKGSSRYIANRLAEKLEPSDVKIIQLSDYSISFCTGCLVCDETHVCNIDDEMNQLVDVVKEADALVFITPARYSLLSGEAKVFIDRLNPTAVTGDIEGKKFIAVAVGQTQKEDALDSISLAAQSLINFAENAGLRVLGKYCIYGCYGPDDIEQNEDVEQTCEAAANALTHIDDESNC